MFLVELYVSMLHSNITRITYPCMNPNQSRVLVGSGGFGRLLARPSGSLAISGGPLLGSGRVLMVSG